MNAADATSPSEVRVNSNSFRKSSMTPNGKLEPPAMTKVAMNMMGGTRPCRRSSRFEGSPTLTGLFLIHNRKVDSTLNRIRCIHLDGDALPESNSRRGETRHDRGIGNLHIHS